MEGVKQETEREERYMKLIIKDRYHQVVGKNLDRSQGKDEDQRKSIMGKIRDKLKEIGEQDLGMEIGRERHNWNIC